MGYVAHLEIVLSSIQSTAWAERHVIAMQLTRQVAAATLAVKLITGWMRDWVVLVARRALPPRPSGRGCPRNFDEQYVGEAISSILTQTFSDFD